MKVVILAGGLGTRITEESMFKPKPMIEIGGKPIIWHIMKIYSYYGFSDFVICCGYKGFMIKEYFAHYFLHMSDVTFDMKNNRTEIHHQYAEPWRVTVVDTGQETNTGGRIRRVASYIQDEPFCLTYGDGVCDINIRNLVDFHQKSGKTVTMSAVHTPGRFGCLTMTDTGTVTEFEEKPHGEMGWINGGFFVVNPAALSAIQTDMDIWERDPLQRLTAQGQVGAFRHDGFWQCMDHMRDKTKLEAMWEANQAPWKVWND